MALATDDARKLTQALVEDPEFLSWVIDYVDVYLMAPGEFVKQEGEILYVEAPEALVFRIIE